MKLVPITVVLSLLAAIAASASNDALKSIPAKELAGITVLGCEAKEPTYTVTCRNSGKCTITVVATRYTCRGIRK